MSSGERVGHHNKGRDGHKKHPECWACDWKKEDPMGDPTHDAARLWVINRKQMARAAVLEQVSARRRKEQWNKQSEQKLADAISKLLEVVDMDQNKMVSLDEFFFAMTVLADQFGLHDIDGQAAMQSC